MKHFTDGSKAYAFTCYNNEDNKWIEAITSAALAKWSSSTMKIVWTINLKNKEKDVLIQRDHHNLYVQSTERNCLFVFDDKKKNIYAIEKESWGKVRYSKWKQYNFWKRKPYQTPKKYH